MDARVETLRAREPRSLHGGSLGSSQIPERSRNPPRELEPRSECPNAVESPGTPTPVFQIWRPGLWHFRNPNPHYRREFGDGSVAVNWGPKFHGLGWRGRPFPAPGFGARMIQIRWCPCMFQRLISRDALGTYLGTSAAWRQGHPFVFPEAVAHGTAWPTAFVPAPD